MIKKNLLLTGVLILIAFGAKSQTNAGFESWQKTGIYDMPDGWANSNLLGAFFNDSASCIKSTNAYNSAYSLKMRPFKSTLAAGEVVPGFAIQTAGFTKRPKTLRFQYHMKAINDTGFISVTLYNKNLQNDTNITGYAEFDLIPNADWQQKSINFNYDNLKSVDSIEISIFSGESLSGFLLIDNITLSDFTSGITVNENKTVKVYPNPSKGLLTIENPVKSNASFKITNLTGQSLLTEKLAQGSQLIDVAKLNSGIYLYQITFENGNAPVSGKLLVE